MKNLLFALTVGFAAASTAEEASQRLFLFVGEPNAAAWKLLIDNPQNRQQAAERITERLGGKVLSYHFGLGNGKNYIIVSLPDDNTLVQAMYVARLGDNLLKSYTVTELLTGEQMAASLKRVQSVKKADELP